MQVDNKIIKSFLITVILLVWLNVFRIAYIHLRPPSSTKITTSEEEIVTTKLKDTSIERRPGFTYPTKGLLDPFRKNRRIKKTTPLKKTEARGIKKEGTKKEGTKRPGEAKKTLPSTKSLPTKSSLSLTTIIWDGVSPVAVLQERGSEKTHIVRVGDLVAGERVEDMTKDSVTVNKEGKEFKLRLGKGVEKKKTEKKKPAEEKKPAKKAKKLRGKAKKEVGKKEAGKKGKAFTGKLKQVIARGVPMKCTIRQKDFSGTSYIKGKKVYSEMTQKGKEVFMIMKDNCMWSWAKDESQGVKMCFETDAWEQEEAGDVPTDVEYRCVPTIFPDSKFNPPANVNFMDMDQTKKAYQKQKKKE